MALSCSEISASIWPIRALIIACVSGEAVIVPAMTWSRRLASWVVAGAAAGEAARPGSGALLMSGLLRGGLAPAGLGAEPLQRVGVVEHVLQQLFEAVVAVHLVQQVGEPVARLQ